MPGRPKMTPEARAELEAKCKAKACVQCGMTDWARKLDRQQTRCHGCQRKHKDGPVQQAKRQREKGRKEAAMQAAVTKGAPPVVFYQGQEDHELPTELDEQLNAILEWCCDRSKGANKLAGCDRIDGELVEVAVPAPHERESRHAHLRKTRDFDAWDAIDKKGDSKNAWRGPAPTAALSYIQEMIDKTFEKMKLHFAGQPIIYHDFSIIMGDLNQQTGSTTGQRVHVDVEMPGAFAIAFLKSGFATKVANYSVEEQWARLEQFEEDIGYSLYEVGMELGTTRTLLDKNSRTWAPSCSRSGICCSAWSKPP